MNEQKERDKVYRGQEAEKILNHPLVVEFFEDYRREVFDKWDKDCAPTDAEGMVHLKMALEARKNFETKFRTHINTGKTALTKLDKIRAAVRK